MYKNKKNGVIGIVITIIILILLVVFTNSNINQISFLENICNVFVMPVQNGFAYLKNKISGNENFFADMDKLKAENEELKQKNSELEQSLRELEIIKAENATLRAYNNMSEAYSEYKTVPGYIISKDISNLSNTMVINIGSDDGVGVNMPVITTEGLVGYTISVTEKTAKVQPIIDPATSISATISTSRDSVVTTGILRKYKHFKINVYSNRCRFSARRYNRNIWNRRNLS